MAAITSQLVASLVVAPAIRSSADCGLLIDWLITCAQPSVMIWLGWPGRLWRLAAYSAGDGKILQPWGPSRGNKEGRTVAAAAAEIVVDDG